ncbi:hypothetical protein D7Z54_33505 [Salibacterium salarium]|uniref:DUF4367 domain-containing protein n=1 Tax=Salibacterium salarium TaxID=284579 RepID=A0A428MSD2_9BACI|nr:hypothetical protein [Salibacterium salarium]RSL29015.1 hypothetical protein D7Z54_33505 [Salibacterium salarium]
MKSIYSLFCFTIIILFASACSSNNSGSLDTSNLEETQSEEKSNREFYPVPRDVALDALPFKVEFPTSVPFDAKESGVAIGSWDNNLSEISLSVTYESTVDDEEIEYVVANFDRFYSNMEADNIYDEITLDDGTNALFQETSFPSSSLHWFKDGKEHNLYYNFVFNENNQAQEELLKIANFINN